MGNIAINEQELQKFARQTDNGPVVMINLLKFKEKTGSGLTGEELYNRYAAQAAPFVAKVGGKVLWQGKAEQYISGSDADRWDKVLLVEYPSRAAFLKMIQMPDFQATQKDRVAALESTALIAASTL